MVRARIGPIIRFLNPARRPDGARPSAWGAARLVPATLRGRIAWVGALLATVGILSVTALQADNTRQTVLAMLESQQQALARRGAAEVGGKLGLSFGMLRSLARVVPRDRLDDADALQALLAAYRTPMDMFQSVALLDPTGRVLACVAASAPARRCPGLGEREHLHQALAAGRPAVSAPLVSRANGQAIVMLTVPLKDLQGRPVAAVAASLDLMRPNLLASLAHQPIGVEGLFMVVTRDGTVVSHRDADLIGTRLTTRPGVEDQLSEALAGPASLRHAVLTGGGRSVLAFEPVPDSDWTVVAMRPEHELVEPLDRIATDEIVRGALAALLVGAALWLVLYWLLRPIEQLRLDLMRLRARPAEAARLVPASSAGEIATLTEEFNALTEARARALEALTNEKNRAQVTLASIGDAVIAIDPDGRIELFNAAAQRLTGWRTEDALGRPLDEVLRLVGAGGRHPVQALHRRALEMAASGTLVPDAELVALDDRRVPVDDTAAPIRDEHGRTVGAVICFRDVRTARSAAAELHWKATHDPLTQLLNRAGFEQGLREACGQAEHGARHALMLLDLDGFKAVNDAGGHDAGDELLRAVARALRETLHESDRIARLGGDEFAAIVADCPMDDAAAAARRVCAAVAALRVTHRGAVYRVQASIGVAPLHGPRPDRAAAMRAADEACYAAKRAGKNQVRRADGVPVGPVPKAHLAMA